MVRVWAAVLAVALVVSALVGRATATSNQTTFRVGVLGTWSCVSQ